MSGAKVLLLSALLIVSGCVSNSPAPIETADALSEVPASPAAVELRARTTLPFDASKNYSFTLEPGIFGILPVQSILVKVGLPPEEGVAAAGDLAQAHMGVWLPDVPEGTKVPVIADVGPYYSDGDVAATTPALRLGKFLIDNFVPHGYAVAQVSVFGSGASTHCMDLMGRSEQLGIDAAVTWLGTQSWSNGNVGLIGRSYDGSTPWEAATFGNTHLKTIVPISGLIGMHELMWRNGSAETRAPIMHNVVYGAFGIDSDPGFNPLDLLDDPTAITEVANAEPSVDPEDAQTLCKDYLLGPAEGVGGYATGSHFLPAANDYWEERSFLPRVLSNYKGSVYLIQGLQDWNVDSHMAFPTHQRLQEAGIEVKGLYGQWAHMYPDRIHEHKVLPTGKGKEAFPASVRYDWAQDLLVWFDHYLMGTGAKPILRVEVQDNQGSWRVEETYPPKDATWIDVALSTASKLHEGADIVYGAQPTVNNAGSRLVYVLPAISADKDVRIAGLAQLALALTPTGPGGQVFARLSDAETGLRIGHAIMDLRYHGGGTQLEPVVPGMPLVARMEFQAFDIVLPAGHGLKLELTATGEDYLPSAINAPVIVDVGATVLRLPGIERGPESFFTPPPPDPEVLAAIRGPVVNQP